MRLVRLAIPVFATTMALLWVLVWPPAYLPHEKIVISVPYRMSDVPDGMIPMGETLYHPKPNVPNGHPGIDFGWQNGQNHDVISSSNGKILSVSQNISGPGKWDVEIESGAYILRYKEMDDYNPELKKSAKINKGELVGHVGRYCDSGHCWFNLHWELASRSVLRDRFCPVTYLDTESRLSIESLWKSVPSNNKVKSQFPEICSGDYSNKTEG